MPWPNAVTLIGVGFPVEQANLMSDLNTAPSVADLIGVNFKPHVAEALGGKAYASRPTKVELVQRGLPPQFAEQLGQ